MTRLPSLRIDAATLPEFVRSTIGLEDLYTSYMGTPVSKAGNFPPYNLVRTGDDNYEIIMAVAGFSNDEVQVEVVDRELRITGRHAANESELEDGLEFLHQGLAMRDFNRTFNLVEYMEVKGATMKDGILRVSLAREIPEAAKPRLIKIK